MHVMTFAHPPSQDAVEAQIEIITVTVTTIWISIQRRRGKVFLLLQETLTEIDFSTVFGATVAPKR